MDYASFYYILPQMCEEDPRQSSIEFTQQERMTRYDATKRDCGSSRMVYRQQPERLDQRRNRNWQDEVDPMGLRQNGNQAGEPVFHAHDHP